MICRPHTSLGVHISSAVFAAIKHGALNEYRPKTNEAGPGRRGGGGGGAGRTGVACHVISDTPVTLMTLVRVPARHTARAHYEAVSFYAVAPSVLVLRVPTQTRW